VQEAPASLYGEEELAGPPRVGNASSSGPFEDFNEYDIANALKGDSQMAVKSAMRERGWPESRPQQRRNQAGENHRIESPSSGKH
jgi:hypothetical protein